MLRKVLQGRLVFTPKVDARGRRYEFAGQAALGSLAGEIIGGDGMVAPTGFEPVFQP